MRTENPRWQFDSVPRDVQHFNVTSNFSPRLFTPERLGSRKTRSGGSRSTNRRIVLVILSVNSRKKAHPKCSLTIILDECYAISSTDWFLDVEALLREFCMPTSGPKGPLIIHTVMEGNKTMPETLRVFNGVCLVLATLFRFVSFDYTHYLSRPAAISCGFWPTTATQSLPRAIALWCSDIDLRFYDISLNRSRCQEYLDASTPQMPGAVAPPVIWGRILEFT
jgi:hypothetical protein